jgi:hypothetical protein
MTLNLFDDFFISFCKRFLKYECKSNITESACIVSNESFNKSLKAFLFNSGNTFSPFNLNVVLSASG